MKPQGKSSGVYSFSPAVIRDLKSAYGVLDRTVRRHPWLVQGSVNMVAPKTPSASVTYTWTRKVRAKTVTVALSRHQATAFRQALTANRRIEEALARLREVSQSALLTALPGVPKRRGDVTKT
jgi:hypothetical protein